ncbi:MAG: PIG-L family deacetylase [Bacilli bacterium]|nr:PIG-L family deacetylase [Bacilli bacterium]
MGYTYFNLYEKYYDSLSDGVFVSSNAKNLCEVVSSDLNRVNAYFNVVTGGKWEESGKPIISNNIITNLRNKIIKLNDYILNNLALAADMAIKSLLPKVIEIKDEDENLQRKKMLEINKNAELDSLCNIRSTISKTIKDDEGNYQPSQKYLKYTRQINGLINEINEISNEITQQKNRLIKLCVEANKILETILALNGDMSKTEISAILPNYKQYNSNQQDVMYSLEPISEDEISSSSQNDQIDLGPADLIGYNKLMIVAHADDEILWGGAHLLSDDYYVVCVSSGDKSNRVKEFTNAMDSTGDKFAMLNFAVYNKKNNVDSWSNDKEEISVALEEIIKLKKWDLIVTHNPEGEYGNSQHRVINEVVTDLAKENNTTLYYFGDYYKDPSKGDIESTAISEELVAQKKEIIVEDYPSKDYSVLRKHKQMLPYENWTLAYQEVPESN